MVIDEVSGDDLVRHLIVMFSPKIFVKFPSQFLNVKISSHEVSSPSVWFAI